jgi:cyclin K
VAAACIFLATKTEECGRKLRDVARVCLAKIWKRDATEIPADSKVFFLFLFGLILRVLIPPQEVERLQNDILLTEEALLEVLCFDFVVDNPHTELVDLFDAHNEPPLLQDYAWSIAHDSFVVLFKSVYYYSLRHWN